MKPTGIGTRQDHTPGSFRIEQSPFDTQAKIMLAIQAHYGGEWTFDYAHIGGSGTVPQATETKTRQVICLWQDARGGWWITTPFMRGFMPDLDATRALAQPAPQDEPAACGNYYADEAAYYAHPD